MYFWGERVLFPDEVETRGTEFQGATHSGPTDAPVAEKDGSTEDKELRFGEHVTRYEAVMKV
jgi:hypothetical protein